MASRRRLRAYLASGTLPAFPSCGPKDRVHQWSIVGFEKRMRCPMSNLIRSPLQPGGVKFLWSLPTTTARRRFRDAV